MTRARGVVARRQKAVVDLHEDGLTTRQIAERIGVTPRSVRRILIRAGVVEPIDHAAHIDLERVRTLIAEGMISTFIAEDAGIYYDTALAHSRRHPDHVEHVHEWDLAWREIRRSERLLALHHEFAPTWDKLRARRRDAA